MYVYDIYQSLTLTTIFLTQIKHAFRKAALQWHPDKFVARYGYRNVCICIYIWLFIYVYVYIYQSCILITMFFTRTKTDLQKGSAKMAPRQIRCQVWI